MSGTAASTLPLKRGVGRPPAVNSNNNNNKDTSKMESSTAAQSLVSSSSSSSSDASSSSSSDGVGGSIPSRLSSVPPADEMLAQLLAAMQNMETEKAQQHKAMVEMMNEIKELKSALVDKSTFVPSDMSQTPAKTTDTSSHINVKTLTEEIKKWRNSSGKEERKYKEEEEEEEEERVRKEESKFKDRLIFEDEDEEESHLESYVKWLEKREQLYPYEINKYKLYKVRYTLLSPWGRYCEWLRTGFYLGFPISLYGRMINKWYKYQQYVAGLYTGQDKIRKVSDQHVTQPLMSYDGRDVRVNSQNSYTENLMGGSFTLSSLPTPLRYTPDTGCLEPVKVVSLQQYTQDQMNAKKLRKRLVKKVYSDDEPTSSSSSSDDDKEEFECATCGVVVHNRPYSKYCLKCENDKKKVKKEYIPSSSFVPPPLEKDYDHKEELNKAILNKVKKERDSVRDSKQVNELPDHSGHILGSILDELFNPNARAMLDITRLPPASTYETAKQVERLVKDLGKFDGNVNKAPTWLHDYCRGVYRNNLGLSDCIHVLTQCFSKEAKAWLEQNIGKISQLASSSEQHRTRMIETLLVLYKEQYMGFSQVNMWKRQLDGTKVTSSSTTLHDIKQHYEMYVTTLNNLRLCDKRLDEDSVKYTYYNSLPEGVKLYIGRDYKSLTTIDDIYQAAVEYLTSHKLTEKKLSDGAMAPRKETTSLNSMDVHENEHIPFNPMHVKPIDPQQTWDKINTSKMLCFHCGKVGHGAYECTLSKYPQTALGAEVFARRNANLGKNTNYEEYRKGLLERIGVGQSGAASYRMAASATASNTPTSTRTSYSSSSNNKPLSRRIRKIDTTTKKSDTSKSKPHEKATTVSDSSDDSD